MEEIQSRFEVPQIMYYDSLFRKAFDLPDFEMEEFEQSLLLKNPEGKELLLDFIFRLLNGCYSRKDIGHDNYDHYLKDIFRFRLEQEQGVKNPLKNTTFLELPVHDKITVFEHLIHFRLDAQDVASGHLKGLHGDSMRVVPVGVDAAGRKYWYFFGVRLYREDAWPVVDEDPKKRTKRIIRSRHQKMIRKVNDKLSEAEGYWDKEVLDYLSSRSGDGNEDQLETPAVRRAARLHVCLEKKDNIDDVDDDEMDLDLQDDEESLKWDSSDEDEEIIFEDHSSDEDYFEKGIKKSKNGKKKKNNGSKTPKAAKTPAGKKAKVPEILRSTPRSARLRAKFGFVDDSTANNSNDSQSSSNKTKNKKKGRKKARHVDDTDGDLEKMDTYTMENESVPENNNTEDSKGNKEARNNEIKQEGDALPQACIEAASGDSTAKEGANVDVETIVDVSDNAASDPNDNLHDSQNNMKEETGSPTTASNKQEKGNTSQENTVLDQTSSDDSCPRVDMKTEKTVCEDEKPDNSDKHPNLKPSKDCMKITIRLPKLEREDTDSQDSKTSGSSEGEKESKPWKPRQETLASKRTGWHLVCEVTQDWEHLVATLENSSNHNQRLLVQVLRENYIPYIPILEEERERERKKKEQEQAPRRLSTRLLYKKKEQADQKRILDEAQLEEDRLRAEEEEERKRRLEEERQEEQRRHREEKERAREERARRVKLREERAKLISEGKEIPPELMNGIKNDRPAPEEQTLDEEVIAKLHKVLAVCFKDEDNWPFVESVEEKMAPGYNERIKNPMHLNEMEEKLNNGRYRSKEEFVADMDLIVDNCESYNGEDHDFSIMARRLRATFQSSMRRFFPVRRPKKDDEDFVAEGRSTQPSGRRYKARREASKKALDSFQSILNDADDPMEMSRAEVSRPLKSMVSHFQGYITKGKASAATSSGATPGTLVMNSMLNTKVATTSKPARGISQPGQRVIEVRTVHPTPSSQAGKPGSSVQKVPVGSRLQGVPPGMLMAVLNTPGKDGTTQKLHCLIPASMVSQPPKGGTAGEEGQRNRPLYVAINRAGSQSTTTTPVTSTVTVLSATHQSGGTVKLDSAGSGLAAAPAGRSLLQTVPQSSAVVPAAAGSGSTAVKVNSPVVLGGKSLLAGKVVVAGKSPASVVGSSSTGNAQVVMVPGKSPSVKAGPALQTPEAGDSASSGLAANSPRPAVQKVQLSREMCLRLLAEKKARVVQQGGKSVFQLVPGVQLVQAVAATTTAAAAAVSQASGVTTTSPPSSLGSGVVTPTPVTPTRSLWSIMASTILTPGHHKPASLSNNRSAIPLIRTDPAGNTKPVDISAAAPTVVKVPRVVDPWSVSDRVTVSSDKPSGALASLSSAQSAGSAGVPTTLTLTSTSSSILPQIVPVTMSSIAPVMVSPQASTGFSGLRTSSGTQGVPVSSVIPVLSTPQSSVCVSPKGQAFMSTGSLISGTGRSVVCSQSDSSGVASSSQFLDSPPTLSHTSPVSAAKVIVLPSNPGWPLASRSLFTSLQDDPVNEDSSDAFSSIGSLPQTVSGLNPSSESGVCASSSVLTTVTYPGHAPSSSRVVPSSQPVRPLAAGPLQSVQHTSAQAATTSATSVKAHSVHVNHSSSSSMQGGAAVSLGPVTVAHNSSCLTNSTPVTVGQIVSGQSPAPSKAVTHTGVTPGRGRKRKSSAHDSDDSEVQSFIREKEHGAVSLHGRTRRNVVSRDYKAFAGYSSKCGAGNRMSSGPKSPARSAETDSPHVKSWAEDNKSPELMSPRTHPAGRDSDPPRRKVICLSPSTMLEDESSLNLVRARPLGGQSPAVSMAKWGPTGMQATASVQEASVVPPIAPVTSSTCGAATQRLQSSQSAHALPSNENVNSAVHYMNQPTESEEQMEVDGGRPHHDS